MSIIGNPIMAGVSGPAASIFVTGLSETDTVTAVHKKTVQVPNPAFHGLPDGYTELEYIESSGTQYIDTGLITSSNRYKIETNLLWKNGDGYFGADYGYWFGLTSDLKFTIAGNFVSSSTASLNKKYNILHEIDSTKTTNNYSLKVDDVSVLSGSFSNFQNGKMYALFAIGQSASTVASYSSAKCYSASILVNDVLVRNYIPAKRISDSAIGLYDLVSNVFYTNAGTGTFVAGSEIPAYIEMTVDDKTLTGKWTQKPNPAYVVPDGYTQLEYIESSGNQYFDTGVVPTNHMVEAMYNMPAYVNDSHLFGTEYGSPPYYYFHFTFFDNAYYWGLNGGQGIGGTFSTGLKTLQYNVGENHEVIQNGVVLGSGSDIYSGGNLRVGCRENGNDGFFGKIYYFRLIDRNSGTLVRNCISAIRNSDGTVGMYDLVNDVFYTNEGTGTFIAGPEIPQTIGGFLIRPIRDFGTWTVTATNGTDTYTQDVLVDVITEYEIEITKKLYLYRDGDENEDITGGWVFPALGTSGFDTNNSSTLIREKQTNAIYLYGTRPSGSDAKHIYGSVRTANSVDLSEFSKLNIQYEDCSFTTEEDYQPRFGPSDVIQDRVTAGVFWKKPYQTPLPSGNGTLTIDISDIEVEMYIVVSIYAYGQQKNTSTVKIKQIWLE